jgi:DNA-binding response OmpR family regulator
MKRLSFGEVGASDRTVLVVDDEASIRLLCRVNLELEGYRVLEGTTVAEGRSALEAADVDVLLVDVHLAGQDGRDLVRELRAEGARTRVALLTGTIDLRSDERAGADAVLEKPFQLEALIGTVRDLVSRLDSPIQ